MAALISRVISRVYFGDRAATDQSDHSTAERSLIKVRARSFVFLFRRCFILVFPWLSRFARSGKRPTRFGRFASISQIYLGTWDGRWFPFRSVPWERFLTSSRGTRVVAFASIFARCRCTRAIPVPHRASRGWEGDSKHNPDSQTDGAQASGETGRDGNEGEPIT